MKNKLTELIKDAMQYADNRKDIGELYKPFEEYIAEYLIDNNTIVTPCKVGDMVWKLMVWLNKKPEIIEGKVSMLQQKSDKSWKIRITRNSSVEDITVEDIGKTVFLTKEEAEKALKGEGK